VIPAVSGRAKFQIILKLPNYIQHNLNIHLACLRTKKGKILAIAHNDENYHAEINVINKIKRKYTNREIQKLCLNEGGFILEVVRINRKNKEFLLSRPCIECQKRINSCQGIVKVYHS